MALYQFLRLKFRICIVPTNSTLLQTSAQLVKVPTKTENRRNVSGDHSFYPLLIIRQISASYNCRQRNKPGE